MNRVIYTPDIFSLQRVGGISRYICELIQHVSAHDWSPTVAAGFHLNRYLRQIPNASGCYLSRLGPVLGDQRLRFNQLLCARAAARAPSAVIHHTYYSDQEFPSSHPVVVTVHDLIDELFPKQPTALPAGWKRHNCEKADHIIAVSENTKKDLVEIFRLSPDKISVIHHGDSLAHAQPATSRRPNERPYLLFVGARGYYKNFERLMQAYAGSPGLRADFDLLSFGGGSFSSDELAMLSKLGIRQRMRHVSGNDAELVACYRGAVALVYPSIYEGFGLPLLEAMGQGCPVICSSPGGSVAEIAGPAAAYFDGRDLESMRDTIEKTAQSAERLTELREAGAIRHQLFSWDKCSEETVSVYRQISSSRT